MTETVMSGKTNPESEWTSLGVRKSVRSKLKELKPYDSMSFNDLLLDMADVYEKDDI